MSPSWTGRWPAARRSTPTRRCASCTPAARIWSRTGSSWSAHTEPLVDDPLLGIEAGLFGGMARVRLEMYGQAEPLLAAALMRCRSEQPQRKELRYWLARAHEGTGRSAAALPLYRAVHRVDPAFMDTAARLAAIAESDGRPATTAAPASRRCSLAGRGHGRRSCEGRTDGRPGGAAGPRPGGRRGERAGTAGAPRTVSARRDRRSPTRPDAPVTDRRRGETGAGRPPRAGARRPQLPRGRRRPGAARAQALAELERMVGLEPVKRQVQALSAQLHMARLRAGPGPAGAAAETALRLLRALRHGQDHGGPHPRPGLLRARACSAATTWWRPNGPIWSASSSGQTAVKANELIDSALGGVLFVDEAYALSNSGYSKGDAYGDEALQVLLKRAEDNRDQLVVILAGYPEGMDRLLAANPGLSSRFTTRVDFPSYRPLELTAIGEVLAAENGDGWDEEALDELRSISGHVVDQGWIDELGNGRFLRTLYEKSCAYRDLRLSGYPATPTRDDLATLRLPDLMQAYGEVLSGRGPGGPRVTAGPPRTARYAPAVRRSRPRPTGPAGDAGSGRPSGAEASAVGGAVHRRVCAGSRTSPTSISSTSSIATSPAPGRTRRRRPPGARRARRIDASARRPAAAPRAASPSAATAAAARPGRRPRGPARP